MSYIYHENKHGLIATFVGMLILTSPASQADRVIELSSGAQQVTLLELFTSQGCSSCPAAERWLNKYADKPELWKDIVPLAFHVDYWDYLGWRDVLASTDYSARQYKYRKQNRIRTVYTPGLVANGQEWRGWVFRFDPPTSDKTPGTLTASVTHEDIKASFPKTGKPMQLNIALLGFGIKTNIKRGENRNSHPVQEFVVIDHQTHTSRSGEWSVKIPATDSPVTKRRALALWVTTADSLVPLQATGGWLDPEISP